MGSLVIVDNDALNIPLQFANRTVTLTVPAKIIASGQSTIDGKKVSVQGDEAKVQLPATYIAGDKINGTGTVTIQLAGDQVAKVATDASKPLILLGSQFTATFTPLIPAKSPPPKNTPDPSAPSTATGTFTASQTFVTAD
jgi:hypothetical protein